MLRPLGCGKHGTHMDPLTGLTDRCWNSQARMMLVATLGKIPRFLFRRRSWSSSSSSPPELGEATLVSSPSPGGGTGTLHWWTAKSRDRGPRTPTRGPALTVHVSANPTQGLTADLTASLHCLPVFSPWSLELSPLWEARLTLDGPGVPKCADPLSSSLIHALF